MEFKPCIALPLEDDVFQDIVGKAKDWAIMHGAGMRLRASYNSDNLYFAPLTLLPSTFPRDQFEKAVKLQTLFNELVHLVAHNPEFLEETLSKTILADDFTGRLYSIYETVRKEGVTQSLSLAIIRSDVMLEPEARPENGIRSGSTCRLKQVEWNTIASGFGHLGPISAQIHRFILTELGHKDFLKNLPKNDALQGLCGGMIAAWEVYNKKEAYILFVVEDISYNICDQRFHEFYIRETRPEIQIIRHSLTEIHKLASLDNEKRLFIGNKEIALVYYRSGYEPSQYHSEGEWDARLLMERSLAIKCPSIQYHLAGTKKVQQALARPGAVEKFFKEENKVKAIREVFTGIYSLDNDAQGDSAVALALSDPERYVLKPQREGGGNNVYGAEILEKVKEMKDCDERNAWILMDRITPPEQINYVLRPGNPITTADTQNIVSELGIFGVILGDDKKVIMNQQSGHMLRSKLSSSNEGGVAAGSGCLDSPFLVD